MVNETIPTYATVTAFDSVSGRWPKGSEYILAYANGVITHGNLEEAKKLFPQAHIIQVSTIAQSGIKLYDVETGDLSPKEGLDVAYNEILAGRRPTLYGSWETLKSLNSFIGLYGPSFANNIDFLLSDPYAPPCLPIGFIGCQYHFSPTYDTSVLLKSWADKPYL